MDLKLVTLLSLPVSTKITAKYFICVCVGGGLCVSLNVCAQVPMEAGSENWIPTSRVRGCEPNMVLSPYFLCHEVLYPKNCKAK